METKVEPDTVEVNEELLVVNLEFSVCPQCGTETISQEQAKKNDAKMRDVYRGAAW
jgi:predicted RNA-binding Zn-ribbon protein involved in translation (DUF1610 family)